MSYAKDLVREVKVGTNVPVYVLEFLLGKYCASEDPSPLIQHRSASRPTDARRQLHSTRRGRTHESRGQAPGQHRLIDKVDVRLVASEDKYWAHLSNFGEKFIHIPEDLVYKYDRLLGGGARRQLDLIYNADDDEPTKRPFFIKALKPIRVAAFSSMEEYIEGRRALPPVNTWL